MDDSARIVKVNFAGSGGSGKTSLILALLGELFYYDYHTTIGADFKLLTQHVGDEDIKLMLWDVNCSDRFMLRECYHCRGSDIILIVADLGRNNSLEDTEFFYKKVLKYQDKKNIFLIGTKNDMIDTSKSEVMKRLTKFSNDNDIVFIDVSAKTGSNIDMLKDVLFSAAQKVPPK